MSYADIRSAVKTRLESISSLDNVHDYLIWSDDFDTLLSFYSDGSTIHEWYIGLGALPSHTVSAGDTTQQFQVSIAGIFGLHTATESSKTFEDKLMDIITSFGTSFNVLELPGVTNQPPTIPGGVETIIWGQFPVHRAVVQLPVTLITNQELLCQG